MGTLLFFKKYGWLAVLSLLLVVVLLVLLRVEPKSAINRLRFTEEVCGIELKLFHDEKEGVYYLFLPAYADKGQVKISKPDGVEVCFSKDGIGYGERLAALPPGEPVTMTISQPHSSKENFTLQIMQGKNIPTIYVETGEGGVESVRLAKGNEVHAAVMAIDAKGQVLYNGISKFIGRGNATWGQPKKPYNLKFNKPINIIRCNDSIKARTWCLLANYGDDSQIRNALSYYIARKVGVSYTSTIDFVSLYVNGEYCGLYNLATKQKYLIDNRNRVDAVFEKTNRERPHDIVSDRKLYIRTRYGNPDIILNRVNAFEAALYNENSSYSDLKAFADVHSLALKYFVESVCANYDLKLSQYYILGDDGRIATCCGWDYDNTFGLSPQYSKYTFNRLELGHPWNNLLFRYPEFRDELLKLLELHSDWLNNSFVNLVDSISWDIEADWYSNYTRWKNVITPWKANKFIKGENYDFKTQQGHKQYICSFMEKRLNLVAEYWRNPENFAKLTFENEQSKAAFNSITLLYRYGDSLTERMLPDGMFSIPDAGFKGWYTKDGVSVADVDVVTQDMIFEERCESPNNGVSSALHKLSSTRLLLVVFTLIMLFLFIKTVIIPIKEAWQ